MFYESILLLGVFAAMLVPLMLLTAATHALLPHSLLRAYVFLCLAAYFMWQWHRGQTLAQRTWKIRIATPAGEPPRLPQLALRYALAWPSLILFGIGILWALFDRDRQFLHDRLAGTRIIFAPPARS